jgi:SAM-dependent methyltransferase
MHEILRTLPRGALVLDLGCSRGSFAGDATEARVIRLDREPSAGALAETFVQGDAARLPFRDRSFDAIVANHSMEHFENLPEALREVGRVVRTGGSLFVSVPDSSTVTDRLYRWLARGGGHVNPFTSAPDLASVIECATGLRHAATKTLFSSLSFLNRRNAPRPRPLRLLFVGAGYEWALFVYVWASRRLDRLLGLRTSVYGWALYFGNVPEMPDEEARVNVCIRCGSGIAARVIQQALRGRPFRRAVRIYRCPDCDALNPFVR